MAKDPAINWYFDNWDGGTKLFTRHQKGCYMDLLSAQFHCGRLTLENIKTVLGSDFGEWAKALQSKFEIDENGMFFNERMEHEILKKIKFMKKQYENGIKGGRPPKKPKENPNNSPDINPNKRLYGIGIENETVFDEKGVQGEKPLGHQMLQKFFSENPCYPQHPVKDMEAICKFANFISDQNGIKNRIGAHTEPEKQIILSDWGKISSWYKSSQISRGLAFVANFQIQEAYTQAKNNLTNGKKFRPTYERNEFKGAGGY